MAKTHGSSKLPLPDEAQAAVAEQGWTLLTGSTGSSYYAFRNRKYPQALLELAAVNHAGDHQSYVFTALKGVPRREAFVQRLTVERLRTLLEAVDAQMRGLNVRVEQAP